MKNILLFLLATSISFISPLTCEEKQLYPMLRVSEIPQPLAFRLSSDPFIRNFDQDLPREGLEKMRLSGSAQFSEKELDQIRTLIPATDVIVIDLRRESHGFVNGDAIAWRLPGENIQYHYNFGFTPSKIEKAELNLLDELLQKEPFLIKTYDEPRLLIPKTVANERQAVEQAGWSYLRLPIRDHSVPDPEQVDNIIQLVSSLSEDTWIHVHCAGGQGRTTVFMSILDIIANSSVLSIDEILRRQHALGGSNLYDPEACYPAGSQVLEEAFDRLYWLHDFYAYCRENPTFETSWTAWLNQKQMNLE